MTPPRRVLVVCTGNLHRSPALAAMLRRLADRDGLADSLLIDSAGTHAAEGAPADPLVAELLAPRGLQLQAHRSRPVSAADLERSDLVIVPAEEHRRWVFLIHPEHLGKIVLLSELAGRSDEVPDPLGGGRPAREAMIRQLDELLGAGWPTLLRHLGLESSQRPH